MDLLAQQMVTVTDKLGTSCSCSLCHSSVSVKLWWLTCVCTVQSVHTCVKRLLHLDGADGRVRHRRKGAHIIRIECDSQEGCHGDSSPEPPGPETKTHSYTQTYTLICHLDCSCFYWKQAGRKPVVPEKKQKFPTQDTTLETTFQYRRQREQRNRVLILNWEQDGRLKQRLTESQKVQLATTNRASQFHAKGKEMSTVMQWSSHATLDCDIVFLSIFKRNLHTYGIWNLPISFCISGEAFHCSIII